VKFLDPCNDWAFKRIFGSKESGPVLVGFLNDLLHQGRPEITEVQILDPYLPSQIHKLKNTAVDVRATLSDHSEVLIEMQMFATAGFRERVLYNGSKCLVSQLGRGSDYTLIRPVTVITVADCILLPDSRQWLNRYALREEKSGSLWPAKGLELIFVELPKIHLSKVPNQEPLHDWLDFLKNATTWRNMPRAVTNPAVRNALHLARQDSLSPSESATMTRRQLYREDQKNMLRHAQETGLAMGVKEGIEKGIQKGLQKGIQKGIQKGMLEGTQQAATKIAQGLLCKGISLDIITDVTGLSASLIRKLKTPSAAEKKRKPALVKQ
jgi:predicted transposase/invertase (TIGR01784 family)